MSLRHGAMAVILSLAAATGWAQRPGDRAPEPPGGPDMQQAAGPGMRPLGGMMAVEFFPPELVMGHQQAIGLKEDQRTAIKAAMQKTMASFTDFQWKQSAEEEALATLVKQQPVDEKKALETFDRLLGMENEVKRIHFAMLVEVKNTLTAEQQSKLRELQRQDLGAGQPPRGRPGPDDRRGGYRQPGEMGGDRQGPPPGGRLPPPEAPPNE